MVVQTEVLLWNHQNPIQQLTISTAENRGAIKQIIVIMSKNVNKSG